MSRTGHREQPAIRRAQASIFAALGDETRLLLVTRIIGDQPRSISELTKGSHLSRQAITKHLRVLEGVGIVRSERLGRESLYEFDPLAIEEGKRYLDLVSKQWDRSLASLKAFVEE
jgi:DNA-binding transcriptional ArsR family regulator